MTTNINALIKQVRNIVATILVPDKHFDQIWHTAVTDFQKWFNGLPAPVSPLASSLELLRRVCSAFDADYLRKNQRVVDIILQGAAKPGDHITIQDVKYEIVRREVSERYGVLYELKNDRGQIIRHEFFE
jgi:hypothetical protein